MSFVSLQTPVLDGGIRSVNFFNGRQLSGEDLTQEKAAQRANQRLLGQAVGEGVASGLEVSETLGRSTASSPVVTVRAGLAINRLGQTLALAQDVDLSLVQPISTTTGATPGAFFADCQPPQHGIYVAGAGLYLLTIGPDQTSEGRAAVSGLGNASASCNTRYQIDTVRFRRLQLYDNQTQLNASQPSVAEALRLRNRIAYRCFGVTGDESDVSNFWRNPFGPPLSGYGLLDELRPACLSDEEVPLAIVYWTTAGIQFIDHGSVRRRLTQLSMNERLHLTANHARLTNLATHERWRLISGNRRRHETEAMFLQFEEQIEEMRVNETDLAAIVATQRFDFLPPFGLLPITGTGSPVGFDAQTFFGAQGSGDIALMDSNRLRSLQHSALDHEPIPLNTVDKIQLYLIWENVKAVERGEISQLVLVFANQTLPYAGVARFGYAKWDRSRVGSTVL